jgi:hypothetical protein
MLPGNFRTSRWDPLLIISQIITLQCLFYLNLTVYFVLLQLVFGFSPYSGVSFMSNHPNLFSNVTSTNETLASLNETFIDSPRSPLDDSLLSSARAGPIAENYINDSFFSLGTFLDFRLIYLGDSHGFFFCLGFIFIPLSM